MFLASLVGGTGTTRFCSLALLRLSAAYLGNRGSAGSRTTAFETTFHSVFQMSRSESYRRFACECMELARVVNDQKTKAILIHTARVWLRLAQALKDDPALFGD